MKPNEIEIGGWYRNGEDERFVFRIDGERRFGIPPWQFVVRYRGGSGVGSMELTLFAQWAESRGDLPRKVETQVAPTMVKASDHPFVRHLAAVGGYKEACQRAQRKVDIEVFLLGQMQKAAYLEHQVADFKKSMTEWATLLGWSPLTKQGVRDWIRERLPLVIKAYHQKKVDDEAKEVVLLKGGKMPEPLQLVLDHSSAAVCPHCGGGAAPTGFMTTSVNAEGVSEAQLEVLHECKQACFRGAASAWPDWVHKETP